jgi:hypothetical protein
MLYLGVSRIACLAVFVFLLLGVALIGLFVSATGSIPTTQTTPPMSSLPMTGVTQVINSTPATQSTRTTGSVSTTQSTSDMVLPNAANETTFMVLPQEVSVIVGDTFSVSVFAENVTNMYAWQVNFTFDSTIVECLNVSVPNQQVFSGKYPVSQALIDFNSTEFTERPLQSIQNDKGYVLAGDCLLGQNQPTFYGSGFLCQVTFKALVSGSSTLALSLGNDLLLGTYYLDEELNLTTPSLSNSTVTVLPK